MQKIHSVSARALAEFAESKTLQDFMQECRDRMTGEWDLYVI